LISIAVVDNEPIFREGLGLWLERNAPGQRLDAEAASVEELLRGHPDPVQVTVLDVMLENGTRLVDNIARLRDWGTEVVVATMDEGVPGMLRAAFASGAQAFVHKGSFGEIWDAVEHCASRPGTLYPNAMMARHVQLQRQDWPGLTDAQVEVLNLLVDGLTPKQIQEHLDISKAAYRDRLQAIRRKAETPDRLLRTRRQLERFQWDYGYSPEW